MAVKNEPKTEAFKEQMGKGRPKGRLNKNTAAIKDMILQALENKGGVAYLQQQADDNPVAFMGLLGKIMPTQITGEDGDAIRLTTVIERRVVKAGH